MDYIVSKKSFNEYQICNICTGTNENVQQSELYNVYGIKVENMIIENNKIKIGNFNQTGSVKYIKAKVNGKIIRKTIVVD